MIQKVMKEGRRISPSRIDKKGLYKRGASPKKNKIKKPFNGKHDELSPWTPCNVGGMVQRERNDLHCKVLWGGRLKITKTGMERGLMQGSRVQKAVKFSETGEGGRGKKKTLGVKRKAKK